ncbi:MAG: DUF4011 domain-containing protein [Magnetococcales bacterium]|nr:DUF4011 domain-containing protein [Magnetococcales bacterium]
MILETVVSESENHPDQQNDPTPTVTLNATITRKISFAFHQNSVPVLREIVIINDGDSALEDLELTISSDPAFLKAHTWQIAKVGAKQRFHVATLDIGLDGGMLARLTEAETATAILVLRQVGLELNRLEILIELLARNQWGGIGSVPELVGAFVQPNDPAVDKILKKAAEVLRKHGKNPALNGYTQGTKERAWELLSAVWSAVCSLGLEYALPPSSFEKEGQKVRSPSQILSGGVATCLDVTLLFASCLEQCGLNPILVFTHGHAFVGCWLLAEDFSSAVVDDVTALRKRSKLDELVVFETTFVCQRPAPTFKMAIERGNQKISEAEEEKFELAVDIRRIRMQRIRPLASTETLETVIPEAVDVQTEPEFESPPDLAEITTHPSEISRRVQGRLDRWQRKLLDLSLRNSLLNFRSGKRAVVIDTPDPGRFEDLLAGGRKFKILPRPDMGDGNDPRNLVIHEERHHEDARRELALDALGRDEVFVGLPEKELDSRLVEIYRSSRSALQEGGANTLFLAMGFLSWSREEKETRYRAPLILIPVTLERRSVRSGFRLELLDDESRFNLTLLEMLRQDFRLDIPGFEGELPKDASGLDIAGIWRTVRAATKDVRGFEVVEDVVLSSFSFAKYLMWKDLVDRTATLKRNPVVRHLMDTPRDPYSGGISFPEPRKLDTDFAPEAIFTPLPTDSSQLAAVIAAARGKDFVLIGPPGTGKSQTIANLIAQCVAEDKSVLFVAEKTAALDVVYRRLKSVGLGEFCLELHSNKAKKMDVLTQLQAAWEAKGEVDQDEWRLRAQQLQHLRAELNIYVERLHRVQRNGLTAFKAIGLVIHERDVPLVELSWSSVDSHDREDLEALRQLADQLHTNAREIGRIAANPLAAIKRNEWSPVWQASLLAAARKLIQVCQELEQAVAAFSEVSGLPAIKLDRNGRHGLTELATVLPLAAGQDWRFVLRPDIRTIIERLGEGLVLLERRQGLADGLSLSYALHDAMQLDLTGLRATWQEAAATWWPKSLLLKGRVRKQLVGKSAAGPKAKPVCGQDLDILLQLKALDQELLEFGDLATKTAGLWNGLGTRRIDVERVIAFRQQLSAAMGGLGATAELFAHIKRQVERFLGDANALLEADGTVAVAAHRLIEVMAHFEEMTRIIGGLVADQEMTVPKNATPDMLSQFCKAILTLEPKLRAWCAWRKRRDEAIGMGLGPLLESVENGTVEIDSIQKAFEVNYNRWWINSLVDRDEVLRSFVPAEHARKIETFKTLDDTFNQLTRQMIRARLCASLPNQEDVKRSSEWGILRHEIRKQKRHMPLRQLINSLPSALPRLAHCLLMSPLSIAQFLSTEVAPFDLVVFDEASQIPVWDAVGAMARGKQVVIVGDSKQLPPTNFFARSDDTDDDADSDEALESILDECLGCNLPELSLTWHYRSRHESLITFSNHRYYGGGLVTFPSLVTDDRAVSYHHVADGVYEKGGARINKGAGLCQV